MKSPFFSVLVTTHNSEKTIAKVLASIINQSFKNFEIVVVDDCSNDKTINIIREYRSKFWGNFKLIQLLKNFGVAYARNSGIDASHGKYIAFVDGDDLWLSNKLLIQYKSIVKYKLDWLFTNYMVIDNKYNLIGKRYRKEGFYNYQSIVNNGNPIGLSTVVVKKKILEEFSFKNIHHEDYDLWIRMAKHGYKGFLINNYLVLYMKHKSLSSNKIRSAFWTYKVFRNNNIAVIKSLKLLYNYAMNSFSRIRNLNKNNVEDKR